MVRGVVRISESWFDAPPSAAGAGALPPSSGGLVRAVRPPIGFLAGGAAAALGGLACALVGNGPLLWLVGWILASFVIIGLVSVFVVVDGRRRQDANYAPNPGLRRLRAVVVVTGIVIAAANAFLFATEVAKQS